MRYALVEVLEQHPYAKEHNFKVRTYYEVHNEQFLIGYYFEYNDMHYGFTKEGEVIKHPNRNIVYNMLLSKFKV